MSSSNRKLMQQTVASVVTRNVNKDEKTKLYSDFFANEYDNKNFFDIWNALLNCLTLFPKYINKEIAIYATGQIVWCSYINCKDPCIIYLHSDITQDFYVDEKHHIYYCYNCMFEKNDMNMVRYNCDSCKEICIKSKEEMETNTKCACYQSSLICDRTDHLSCDSCMKPSCNAVQCYITMCGDKKCQTYACVDCASMCEQCGWFRCFKCSRISRAYLHLDDIMSVCNILGMLYMCL